MHDQLGLHVYLLLVGLFDMLACFLALRLSI